MPAQHRISGGEPGQQVGAYQLIRPLGEGGMGVVYRARHEDTGEVVALKIVHVTNEALLASFRREIFALRCIEHPLVVRIVDDGVDDGQPWYAMELLRGRSLADYIDGLMGVAPGSRRLGASQREVETVMSGEFRSPPPDGDAPTIPPLPIRHVADLEGTLTLMRALCSPLAFVHGAGIVHRDLKPENVLIRDDGRPVILDFGLALHFGGGEQSRDILDVAGRALGTPPYMAPEQIRGDLVDARADLYALGCMLFECLTGSPPFVGTPVITLQQHLSEPPPLPSQRVLGVPPELDALVARLLAKAPRERFGFAVDVASALADLGARDLEVDGPSPRPYLYRPTLAGRSSVLAEVKPLLEKSAEQCGGTVLIGGRSGVGKTRLAMELATWAARRGANVVTGQCLDSRGDSGGISVKAAPLHPLRPALHAIADRCRTGGLEETERILGERGPVLSPYAPILSQLLDPRRQQPLAELPADAARFRLLDALATSLMRLSEAQPIFIVVDDLQWADELTLAFLQHLDARFFASAAVFIVGTYRNDEETEALRTTFESDVVTLVELGVLDQTAVSNMVSDMLALDDPPEALVEFLMTESEGNPFFIAEYLRSAIGERILRRSQTGVWSVGVAGKTSDSLRTALPLPGGLRDLVERRIDALDADGRALVELASVIGRQIDGDVLVLASHLDEPAARGAIEQLRSRHVLEEDDHGGLRFVHDKVREVVHAGVSIEARVPLHLAAAEAIEAATEGASRSLQYAVLAHHFSLGGDYPKAITYLEQAGDLALSSAASGEAKRFFQSAIDLDEKHQLKADGFRVAAWQRRLGEAHYNLGELARARQCFIASLSVLHDGRAFRVPFVQDERVQAVATSVSAAIAQLKTLVGVDHPVSERPETRARWREAALAAERLAQVHYFLNEQNLAFGAALRCAQLAEGLGPSAELARAYATLSVATNFVPVPGLMARYGKKALAIAQQVDNRQAQGFVAFLLGLNSVGAGSWGDARAHLGVALKHALAVGDVRAAQEIRTLTLDAMAFSGDCRESLKESAVLLDSAERTKNKQALVWAKGTMGMANMFLGRTTEALRFYEDIESMSAETGDTTSVLSEAFKAVTLMMASRWSDALSVADQVRALSDVPPSAWHCCHGYMAASDVYLAAWERALVREEPTRQFRARGTQMVAVLERSARMFAYARPDALRLRGFEQWLLGKRRRAQRSWRRAIANAQAMGMPFAEARAHWEIARHAPLGARQRVTHARLARAIYERLGAERWVDLTLQLPRCWR